MGLLLSTILTLYTVFVMKTAPSGYSVQLHSNYTSAIPLNLDIEVYKNKCEGMDLTFLHYL